MGGVFSGTLRRAAVLLNSKVTGRIVYSEHFVGRQRSPFPKEIIV